MSISSLRPVGRPAVRPVVRPAAAAKAAAPVARPASAPVGGGLAADLGKGLDSLGAKLRDLIGTPYRALVGPIGVDNFVRPGKGTNDGDPPSKWGLNYETLEFKSTDGTPLKGWYMPADKPTDKTIVLAHGHGGQMSDVGYQWAPWLQKAGYNVLTFDFRNSGGSGGDKTTMGFEERRDLDAALSQAQAKGAKHIAVMGLSMGAATALSQAAADKRIEAIVADCPFDTITNAVASRVARNTFDLGPLKGLHFPWQKQATKAVVEASEQATGHTESSPGGALRDADPLRAMPKLKDRPVFLIHGQADDETLPSASVNLAKADPNAELWLVPGAAHGQSYKTARKEYQAKVLDFLARSF